ncbi:MAG: hypothetical protein ACLR2O_05730 [Coprococcus sp.]
MDGTTRNFTYDANGNLLSDGKYTYSWTKGSLLAKVTGDSLEATYLMMHPVSEHPRR